MWQNMKTQMEKLIQIKNLIHKLFIKLGPMG